MTKKQLLSWLFRGTLLMMGLFLWYVFFPWFTTPELMDSSKIFDASGSLLYEIHAPTATKRTYIEKENYSPYVREALIASEDKNFYTHHGVDLEALFRAFMQNTQQGTVVSGASTLTSQLVKETYYPTSPRTYVQKIRESIGALAYDLIHSKEDILNSYINRVYFGNKAYGIEAASLLYFSKSTSELTLGETAYLIGLIPAPESYNPFKYPEKALTGQRVVLQRMKNLSMITEEEFLAASTLPIDLDTYLPPRKAPHFVDYILESLKKTYPDIEAGGYEVYTTLNSQWQADAEEVVEKQLSLLKRKQVGNGGVVVIEPSSGKIRVMVGGSNYHDTEQGGQVNVTLALRQPGSSLKPFTYLTAFLEGKNPSDIAYDVESTFETSTKEQYTPKNYDLRYHGPIPLEVALGSSLNIVAVQLLNSMGLASLYETLKEFDITFPNSPEHYGLGITLGGGEVNLLKLTHAYSMLANGGDHTALQSIEKITKNGRELPLSHEGEKYPLFPSKALRAKQAIYLLSQTLRKEKNRELSFGISNMLSINEHVAVKTGTTKDFRDNWALGYTPKITVGVWVGNNDNSPMEGVSGITGAVPIWHDFLRRRKEETLFLTEKDWNPPSGLIQKDICSLSGKLATPLCPERNTATFIEEFAPKEVDTWYKKILVDEERALLWKEGCSGKPLEKTALDLPQELHSWAKSVHMALLPTYYCDGSLAATNVPHMITHPKAGDTFYMDLKKPLEGQKIPITIEGIGSNKYPLFLDGQIVQEHFTAPFTFFLKPFPGEHVIQMGSTKIPFLIKEK